MNIGLTFSPAIREYMHDALTFNPNNRGPMKYVEVNCFELSGQDDIRLLQNRWPEYFGFSNLPISKENIDGYKIQLPCHDCCTRFTRIFVRGWQSRKATPPPNFPIGIQRYSGTALEVCSSRENPCTRFSRIFVRGWQATPLPPPNFPIGIQRYSGTALEVCSSWGKSLYTFLPDIR